MAKDQYSLAIVATFLVTLIPSPFYFLAIKQFTVNKCYISIVHLMDSNLDPLVLEATALPTLPPQSQRMTSRWLVPCLTFAKKAYLKRTQFVHLATWQSSSLQKSQKNICKNVFPFTKKLSLWINVFKNILRAINPIKNALCPFSCCARWKTNV